MNSLKKLLNLWYIMTMLLYLVLGAVIVLVQAFAVLSGNGALSIWATDVFLPPACIACTCTSMIAWLLSYLHKKDS